MTTRLKHLKHPGGGAEGTLPSQQHWQCHNPQSSCIYLCFDRWSSQQDWRLTTDKVCLSPASVHPACTYAAHFSTLKWFLWHNILVVPLIVKSCHAELARMCCCRRPTSNLHILQYNSIPLNENAFTPGIFLFCSCLLRLYNLVDAVIILASLSLALSSSTSFSDCESGGEDLEAAAEGPQCYFHLYVFAPWLLKTRLLLADPLHRLPSLESQGPSLTESVCWRCVLDVLCCLLFAFCIFRS